MILILEKILKSEMESIIVNIIDVFIEKISLKYGIEKDELKILCNKGDIKQACHRNTYIGCSLSKYINIQKPFLKWVGGKSQIINNILDCVPKEIENYHEPFLGGGSVLLAVLSLQKHGKINIKNDIFVYDINTDLINLYKNIQKSPEEFHNYLTTYFGDYDESKDKEVYYYSTREKFNKKYDEENQLDRSAMFLFLNKTCFRGVYREGPNGFNVPYGHYKTTPEMISLEELKNISNLIKNVKFIQCSFEQSFNNFKRGDYIYLDPPYAPENTKSFVGYTKDGFKPDMHNKLFRMIVNLDGEIKFTMSNSNVKLVLDFFDNDKYIIKKLEAKRSINSKNPSSKTTEVIISN